MAERRDPGHFHWDVAIWCVMLSFIINRIGGNAMGDLTRMTVCFFKVTGKTTLNRWKMTSCSSGTYSSGDIDRTMKDFLIVFHSVSVMR